jgi:hypothetical protein
MARSRLLSCAVGSPFIVLFFAGGCGGSHANGDGGNARPAGSSEPGPDSVDASGASPIVDGCAIFPADNPWNTRIDDPTKFPVHASSATFLANMNPSRPLHPDWGNWSSDHYGIPWQSVDANQATVPLSFQYADESDPGPYPIPPGAKVEGGGGDGDRHVLVLQKGKCFLYETFASSFDGSGWTCGSGAVFDLSSNKLRPDGWTSADAAGLPIFPGLVRLSEVKAGAVKHAIRMTVSQSQQGYIHPATHAAGHDDASLAPMGLRVRLKTSFDLTKFKGPALVVLTAMKQSG